MCAHDVCVGQSDFHVLVVVEENKLFVSGSAEVNYSCFYGEFIIRGNYL